jgi:hypothetical protein
LEKASAWIMLKTKIRKINPQKSNKMIYAVAAGLAVIILVFLLSIVFTSGGGDKKQALQKTLAYLKNTEGLVEIKTIEAENRVVIVFNSDSQNAGNFKNIAHYAALRLSYKLPDCQVQLAKNLATQIVYSVRVKNGAIASEGPVQAESN